MISGLVANVLLLIALVPMPGADGRIESVAGQTILHLEGSPRDMGKQQGRLLREQIEKNIATLVHQHAVAEHGLTLDELDARANAQIGAWPKELVEELEGLAEGSGVPVADLRRLQVVQRPIPARAGVGYASRTLGARLLQLVSLEPGHSLAPESIVAIYHSQAPTARYASITWAGYLGSMAGINEEGISTSVLQVSPSEDHAAGLIAPILARSVLASAKTIPAAITTANQAPRSGSWIMLVGDGKVPTARAIEMTATSIAEFGPNDTGERVAPFKGLVDIVRRSNHFISEKLRAQGMDLPWQDRSLQRYGELSDLLDQPKRRLGAIEAVHELRKAAEPQVPTMLAVLSPSDATLWVGFSSGTDKGASGEAIVGYSLRDLWAHRPAVDHARVDTPAHPLDPATERSVVGTIRPTRASESSIPEMYRMDTESFEYEESPDNVGSGIVRTMVKIPSPVVTPYPENNTIPVEVFRPRGDGPWPYIIVTHIAGGDFELSRFVATTLANSGLACAFIKLPYYGERQPPGKDIKMLQPDVEVASGAMAQAIKDIRRVCDWIEGQPDLEAGKIGICGISLGSITGALATAIEPRITHACLIIGGGSLHDLVFESVEKEAREFRRLWTESGGTRESLGALMKSFDPVTYGDRLRERTVFMINASQDESVPVTCGKALWEAAGKQKIVWYPCGHYTIVRYIMPALQQTVQFFKAWPDRSANVETAQGG